MPDDIRNNTESPSQDTRGPFEKLSDAVTNDRVDDKTGKVIREEGDNWGQNEDFEDTRGPMEKVADTVTGDRVDDKTGRVVEDKDAYDPDEVARRNDWIDPDTDLDPVPPAFDYEPNRNLDQVDDRDAIERAADALTGDDIDDPAPRTHIP